MPSRCAVRTTAFGVTSMPSRTATVVDTRTGTPVGTATGSMITRRRQHNLTVLADGSVLATGGQKTNGGGGLVDLANPAYTAERWDPATGAWTELAAAAVARQYHSVALLLPDGRVLTSGAQVEIGGNERYESLCRQHYREAIGDRPPS